MKYKTTNTDYMLDNVSNVTDIVNNAGIGKSLLDDNNNGVEPDVFFYHSDHLGSASWITERHGDAVQHLQYLPYGERYIDQHPFGYSERFTFTGKELDEETGYGYFGARYMDHELMTGWLSVDPMADKYPNISPYAYCNWNPVKLVDPDGRDFDPIMQEYASSLRKYCNSQITKLEKVGSLMDRQREQLNGFRNTIFEMDKLENDHSTLYCFGKHENNKANEDIMGFTSYGGVNEGKNVINITIREDGFLEGGGLNMKGVGAFAHELKHAFQFYSGESAFAIKEGIESRESIAYNSSELETSAYNRGALFGGLNAIQKRYNYLI